MRIARGLVLTITILGLVLSAKHHKKLQTAFPTSSPTIAKSSRWIVGGTSSPTPIPGIATLVDNEGSIYCLCSVIGTSTCITSADCILESRSGSVGNVISNLSNSSQWDASLSLPISYFSLFSSHIQGSTSFNYALVFVTGNFSDVPLSKTTFDPGSVGPATYISWGVPSVGIQKAQTLQTLQLQFYSSLTSVENFYYQATTQVCGGSTGGALVYEAGGLNYLVGVGNQRFSCQQTTPVALFSRTPYYFYWIDLMQAKVDTKEQARFTYVLANGINLNAFSSSSFQVLIPRGLRYVKFSISYATGNPSMRIQYNSFSVCNYLTTGLSNVKSCSLFAPMSAYYQINIAADQIKVTGLVVNVEVAPYIYVPVKVSSSSVSLSSKYPYRFLSIPVLPLSVIAVTMTKGDLNAKILIGRGGQLPNPSNTLYKRAGSCTFAVPPDLSAVSIEVIGSTPSLIASTFSVRVPQVLVADRVKEYSSTDMSPLTGTFYYGENTMLAGSQATIQFDLFSGSAAITVTLTNISPSSSSQTVCDFQAAVQVSNICSFIIPTTATNIQVTLIADVAVFRMTVSSTVNI